MDSAGLFRPFIQPFWFGQPTKTQFRCPNPIPREEIKTE